MRISLSWLKDYVSFALTPAALAHKLTLSGSEVEKEELVGGDIVFELEITPNRPDCLNMIGMAREISAILNKPFKKPKIKRIKFSKSKCAISIENKKDCGRYIGAILTDVKIAQSPSFLQKKLSALGLRPINNIVDITNFCLMETGQPMHAFDYDKLEGGKIIVRRAKKGEKIVAIDEVEYELDPSILIIADAKRPVAIAGVMGGKKTEVTSKTKNILLESAYFDPVLIRRASRKLALRSDSSYRFERGVDIDMVEQAAWRALNLIQELALGKADARKDVYPAKANKKQKKIKISKSQIENFLGANIPLTRIKNILTKLEFKVSSSGKDSLLVTAPSFRKDIQIGVDVTEEIARIIGYDNLPMRLAQIKAENVPTSKRWIFKEKLRQAATGLGLSEVISYTMVGLKALENTKQNISQGVINQNPLTEDQQILRPSALPSFLNIVATNFKKGQKDLKIFEIGKNYFSSGEKDVLIVAMTGKRNADWRSLKEKIDFYDIKGSLDGVLKRLKITNVNYSLDKKASFVFGQSAAVFIGGKKSGFLGKVSSDILERWDIKHQDVFYAEVDIETLYQKEQKLCRFQKVSDYPSVVRDISLAVKEYSTFQKVCDVIDFLKEPLLKEVSFVEQYLGEKVPVGCRGITISLTYQSGTRTLTEQEVEKAHQVICQKIISDLDAIKR
ncbi:MAG: phenylalanine--tRNA ligase subunit beta [Candidatus Aceula meridiana]|nr:phenylalanine--tRNA ligase subunit beta [Candidatus Aceula meridiana]